MNKLWLVLAICIIIGAATLAGCTERVEGGQQIDSTQIKDFGNGVLFFPFTNDGFGYALSNYIAQNNATVLAIVPEPIETTYNTYEGYWVIVK